MGHLRAHCPNKISKPYPFNVLVSSMYIGVNECCDEVCSPSLCVDRQPLNSRCHRDACFPGYRVSRTHIPRDACFPAHISLGMRVSHQ